MCRTGARLEVGNNFEQAVCAEKVMLDALGRARAQLTWVLVAPRDQVEVL